MRKRETQRKAEEAKKAEEQKWLEDANARRDFNHLILTYGDVGIIKFAVEQQEAAYFSFSAPPKFAVQRMDQDEFQSFISDVFKRNPQLAERILCFFRLVEDYDNHLANGITTTLKEILEAAPPLLQKFYKLYAPRGLKGAALAIRNRQGLVDIPLHRNDDWWMVIASNHITMNIKIVLGEKRKFEYLNPKFIERPFFSHWGVIDYSLLKADLSFPLPHWRFGWDLKPAQKRDISVIIKPLLIFALHSALESIKRKRRRIQLLAERAEKIKVQVERTFNKLSDTTAHALRIRDYYNEKFRY